MPEINRTGDCFPWRQCQRGRRALRGRNSATVHRAALNASCTPLQRDRARLDTDSYAALRAESNSLNRVTRKATTKQSPFSAMKTALEGRVRRRQGLELCLACVRGWEVALFRGKNL